MGEMTVLLMAATAMVLALLFFWLKENIALTATDDRVVQLIGRLSPPTPLTEQCGHETFQISGFWADDGQTAPYCLLRPKSV